MFNSGKFQGTSRDVFQGYYRARVGEKPSASDGAEGHRTSCATVHGARGSGGFPFGLSLCALSELYGAHGDRCLWALSFLREIQFVGASGFAFCFSYCRKEGKEEGGMR